MHAPKEYADQNYVHTLNQNKSALDYIFGPCTVIQNYQQLITPKANIDYDMSLFDVESMKKYIAENDPIVLKQCFDLGVRLATKPDVIA